MMKPQSEPKPLLMAGFASEEIPCPAGTPLAGYAGCRQSTGSHDPLLIQTAVLIDGNKRCKILVTLDLLAVDSLIKTRVEQLLNESGVYYEALILQAIHTHCAPAGLLQTNQGFLKAAQYFADVPNTRLAEEIARRTVFCILKAIRNAKPTQFQKASFKLEGFASDRVNQRSIESSVFVVEAESSDSKVCFVFAANHPTVLPSSTTESSADFVWGLREYMKKEGFDQTFFCNGPCGDLSTRYTRKGSDFVEAKRLGSLLGQEIRESLEHSTPFPLNDSDLITIDVPLPACDIPDPDEAEQALQQAELRYETAYDLGADPLTLRQLHVAVETAQVMVQKAKTEFHEDQIWIQSYVWKWDDEIFVTYPGELFSTLPFEKNPHVHVLCYANGYNLYLADKSAYERQIYEALCSPFSSKAAEVYNEAVSLCLKDLQ